MRGNLLTGIIGIRIKNLNRLWISFSHLPESKLRHTFAGTLNSFCSCNTISYATKKHYELMVKIRNHFTMHQSIGLLHVVLYCNKNFDKYHLNTFNLSSVKFIKERDLNKLF